MAEKVSLHFVPVGDTQKFESTRTQWSRDKVAITVFSAQSASILLKQLERVGGRLLEALWLRSFNSNTLLILVRQSELSDSKVLSL